MMKTKKILLFDNYDSFTYNLVHAIKSLGYSEVDVKRNNKIELADVNQYDKIILSPGPGVPEEAGIMLDLIKEYAETKSILGVCLGHQAIGQVFGAGDRKSTRLNSSHVRISYAVFCLKKKKKSR